MRGIINQRTVTRWQEFVNTWPIESKETAQRLVGRYDSPHQATRDHICWFYNSPWRQTVIYRRGRPHNFPRPHEDILKQVVGFQVPAVKIPAIMAFAGNLEINRQRGELAAICGSEEMNRILFNLVHDIVVDRRTVEEAQTMAARMAHFVEIGWPEPYAQGLLFALTDDFVDTLRQDGRNTAGSR